MRWSVFPFGLLGRVRFVEHGGEGFGEGRAELLVVGDVEAVVERLVRQPPVAVVGVLVGVVCVGEQAQGVVEERASADVVFIVLGEAVFDVREAGADAVLVSFQGGQVDGVGEVRGEELVALGFDPGPVRGEVGELLILSGAALVERCIDLRGDGPVVVLVDRDRGVGVLDQPFGDLDGDGSAGAGGLLGGAAGADEVGVGGAAGVGGEVQQHSRPAGAAVQ
ncbi:hypothetical protein [Microbacterium sp.]|uniref:hypothetical protein n=1 Tax=Microbacterium sp. TaxID=51671 RepID=UPI00257BBF4A|nr:hypothetical protein [Microbacterium sp.]